MLHEWFCLFQSYLQNVFMCMYITISGASPKVAFESCGFLVPKEVDSVSKLLRFLVIFVLNMILGTEIPVSLFK